MATPADEAYVLILWEDRSIVAFEGASWNRVGNAIGTAVAKITGSERALEAMVEFEV